MASGSSNRPHSTFKSKRTESKGKKNRVKQNKFKLHIHKNHTINKWKKVVVDTMIFHINIFVSFNWFYKIFASKFSIKNEAIIVQSGRLLLTLYKSYTYSHIIDFNSDLRADLWWLQILRIQTCGIQTCNFWSIICHYITYFFS